MTYDSKGVEFVDTSRLEAERQQERKVAAVLSLLVDKKTLDATMPRPHPAGLVDQVFGHTVYHKGTIAVCATPAPWLALLMERQPRPIEALRGYIRRFSFFSRFGLCVAASFDGHEADIVVVFVHESWEPMIRERFVGMTAEERVRWYDTVRYQNVRPDEVVVRPDTDPWNQ